MDHHSQEASRGSLYGEWTYHWSGGNDDGQDMEYVLRGDLAWKSGGCRRVWPAAARHTIGFTHQGRNHCQAAHDALSSATKYVKGVITATRRSSAIGDRDAAAMMARRQLQLPSPSTTATTAFVASSLRDLDKRTRCALLTLMCN